METIQEPKVYKAKKDHKCNYCLGVIPKNSSYEKATFKVDNIYTWKNHIECQKIAVKLDLFAETDGDGLSSDSFRESIHCEWKDIMIKNHNTVFDSRYEYPKFSEQLQTVLQYYKI